MGSVSNSLLGAANTLTNTPVTSSNSSANSTTGSSSSSSGSGDTNTTGIFTGTSAYSQDLQNVISREVAIASMPITLLTDQQSALSAQSSELTTLDTDFTALQTAITGIGTAMGGASFQSTSSAPSAVSATLSDGATEGVYNITVDSVGSTATSLSTVSWNQPALASGQTATYGLVVGNQEYSVTTSDNSAQGVAAAIQQQYGNLVDAVAVNVGSNQTCISLQSTTLGGVKLNILQVPSSATPASLQTPNTAGYAVSQTTNTWPSAAGAYSLVVNGNSYSLSPATNSAQDMAAAINSAATANELSVNATVVNVGTSSSPDNRIELAGTTAAITSVNLQNNGANLQTAATSLTAATWNAADDAAGTQSLYTLDVGANTYNFTVGGDNGTTAVNSAQNVAAAINSQFGAMVNATVVDLGTSGNHDYRIALQDKTGTNPTLNIQQTAATSLQTQQVNGAPATYSIDGAAQASSNSDSIVVANGVTLNLLGTNADPTTGKSDPVSVTVTQSSSAISTALSTFATAYNACVTEITGQRGQQAGPLQGTSILTELSQTLSNLSTYGSSNGSISTLHDLGLDLGANGQLTYTALNFLANSFSSSADIDAFLGVVPNPNGTTSAATTGSGFLAAASNALTNLEDPTVGLLKNAETDLTSQITDIGTQISTKQDQVDTLQTTLTNQMAAADAAIATMEQQYSYLSSMLAAQQTANQQYSGE